MKSVIPDYLGETARRINLQTYPDVRQFVVQHLYPDTLRLLLLLHKHVRIDCVIGIGYSGKPSVVEALRDAGINVLTPAYPDLLEVISSELGMSLDRCQSDGCRLLIHEVGGYAITCLHEEYSDRIDQVAGAIEVTKQGVWAAKSLPRLRIPQLNCAETRLKQVEGKLVGESVVAAFDNIARDLGMSLTGRDACLLGYGWVGKGAALSLSARGMRVTVKDTDTIKMVGAVVDGFAVARGNVDFHPEVVIGASGHQSISAQLIDQLPTECFIASGSSKDVEIDLSYLNKITVSAERIHQYVDALTLSDGRCLYLVNGGYPVNFTGSSVPDEIVEFLFSELIMLVPELLNKNPPPGTYPLPTELENIAAEIWLDLR